MKTITFIRHAKSDRSLNVTDFERPLNSRGKSDAEMMGQVLLQKNIKPDLIVSSPAKRAISTANILSEQLNMPKDKIQENPDLYFANTNTFLEIIKTQANQIDHIFLVSHNPGITDIINFISNIRLDYMPTCGIAQFIFNIEKWEKVGKLKGKLDFFEITKAHKA
jgi:phosphohistidine phosphatase